MRAVGLVLAPLAAALVFAGFDSDAGIRTWWRLRADLAAAEERITALHVEVEALERSAGALRQEPFALERAIREDLDWVRPGEVLVRMPVENDAPAPLP